ncbi:MAG: OmpA family protein [Bacteroidales bacterium]|nr:OmpA family protein [Bacteroidales bacterium]
MVNKVRVYGKAQNRTALGIMNAYMVMYPHATMEDLQKAFPNELNPDSGVKVNFVKAGDKGTDANWNGFFQKDDELLTMGDGTKVAVVSMWTKPSFDRLVSHAAQYGIEVAKFEESEGGGKKGSFRLEYLNGYVPPAPKKKIPMWVWIVLVVIVIAVIVILAMRGCREQQVVVEEKIVTDTVVVRDTVFLTQIEEIESNYNAAEFVQGKADLSESAKFVLHDLAKVMQKHPEIRLRLEGHTSAEGDVAANQKLSEDRAQAAVDFLVNHEGIDASRLEAVGKGSTELKNTDDPMAPENRRTEFIVLE